jgi:hypothetical protein
MLPSPADLSHHERAVLTRAAEQVDQACERPWIAALARTEIEDAPCKNDRSTAVEDDGSCLRCGADQGEGCRS